jgi:hypothetical protein
MKLYIAGPRIGLPELNYPAFMENQALLINYGYVVYNPANLGDIAPPEARWSWFMHMALKMVLESDGVALMPGWENSQGARLEQYVALNCGIPVKPIMDWVAESYPRKSLKELTQ